MSKNTKSMNDVFGRSVVSVAEPDKFWPLPSELVGIEIEVENLEGDSTRVFPQWSTHIDQSLRNGIEFVTSGPVGGKALTHAIKKFFDAKFKYDMSARTSTHIHVNASDNMTIDEFRTMFSVMYLLEPAVFRWADDNRKWCGYCAPLTDLDPSRIISILNENNDDRKFVSAVRGTMNADRYYGFNVASYQKHGTAEFRYFPCTDNAEELISWVKFVMYVKRVAKAFDSPGDFLATLTTRNDVHQFISNMFTEVADPLLSALDFDDCLGRVEELKSMLGVNPRLVVGSENYMTVRSKGFTKLLASKFPGCVVSPDISEAKVASRISKSAFDVQAFMAYQDILASASVSIPPAPVRGRRVQPPVASPAISPVSYDEAIVDLSAYSAQISPAASASMEEQRTRITPTFDNTTPTWVFATPTRR